MRFSRSIVEYFGFTKAETKVILFILGAFLVGGAIKLYEFYFQSGERTETPFDYTEADREFQERSAELRSHGPSEQPRDRVIPEESGSVGPERSGRTAKPAVHRFNINTASKGKLMSLPGIGEALAERIILYRERHGPFTSAEDLKKVRGIGDRKFDQLKSYISLE